MARPLRIMLAAVEPSGDSLGADLIEGLRAAHSGPLEIFGCGGPAMVAAGLDSAFSVAPLAVMGFTDAARVYGLAKKRVRDLVHLAQVNQPHAVVFVDGWAFSRLGAAALKRSGLGLPVFKYVAPQIWASRPQRIDFVKRHFDGVLTVLPFEAPLFEKEGVQARYVGNPVFQAAYRGRMPRAVARGRLGLEEDAAVLALLPGSRSAEVSRLGPVFRDSVEALRRTLPGLRAVLPAHPNVMAAVKARFEPLPGVDIVPADEKYSVFAAADAALAASGTVTTELAIHQVPQIIAYRVDPLTAFWARRVVVTPYASILNVMADAPVIPEILQQACTAERLATEVLPLLTEKEVGERQIRALAPQISALDPGGPPAGQVAADQFLAWIDGRRS